MSKRVKSFVRIRPYIQSQDGNNTIYQYAIDDKQSSINIDQADYTFDRIFAEEHNNDQIYENSLKLYIKDALKGINTTVFAYGQTCSGKTHTIFGHRHNEKGIIYSALEDIFSQNKSGQTKVKASISFYEIYNEQVNDLLGERECIQIKEVNGSFVLLNIAEMRVTSADEAIDLLKFGNDNKAMGCSYLHEKSSRSHCIFRINLAIQNKGLCEINFVDLAGSELLTDTYGTQQQKETKNINMSLFNLKNVIFSLSENAAFIPYRNSSLTKLLQNSLGGNSQTAIFCMVSPLDQHLQHSKRTLSFGQTASKIVNNLLIQKSIYKKEIDIVKENVKINEQNIQFNKPVDGQLEDQLIGEYKVFDNEIQIFSYGELQNQKNLAIFLPAYGSSGRKYMAYTYNALIERNFYIISMDYPGQNQSLGQKLNVRGHEQSVPFLDRLIKEQFSKYENIVLFGYDYGAGLALNYGIKNNPKIKQIFSFHPAWSQDLAILKDVKQKVILLWVTAEQLHPISQGVKMNKIIPKCKLIKLNCGKFNADKPKKAYKCIGDQITQQVLDNLDPIFKLNNCLNASQAQEQSDSVEVEEQKQNNQITNLEQIQTQEDGDEFDLDELLNNKEQYLYYKKNIRGACLRKEINKEIQQQNNYMFLQEPSPNSSPLEMQKWAIGRFKELLISGDIKEYYKGYLNSTQLRTQAIKLFGNLPTLQPYETDLEKFKLIWGSQNLPKNLNKIRDFPRFQPGRQVQVKTKVNPYPYQDKYLEYDQNGDICITHKGYIQSYNESNKSFSVKINQNVDIDVHESEIYRLNCPTNFSGKPLQEGLLFEDGIRCKYGDLLTKAKLTEAALSISDIVGNIDYNKSFEKPNDSGEDIYVNDSNLQIQQKCVERISKCIDLIHLVQEGIHPSRYIAFECGKLAYFGQGNCHTLASVVCAFLLPFSSILGLEVKFRAGSLLKQGREIDENMKELEKWDGKLNKKVEDHTWVEITYQPCQQSFVFDKSDYINNMSIDQAYSRYMHISDRNQCNSLTPDKPVYIYHHSFNLQDKPLQQFNLQSQPYGNKNVFPSFNWNSILSCEIA